MALVIETQNLEKRFIQQEKRKRKVVEAVKGIDLEVEKGEIFGFLGPNGAGKTTTLRMLTTLLPIDEGEATVASYDIKRNPEEVRKRTGYVSQLGGVDNLATGGEDLILQGRLYGMNLLEANKRANELADTLDLKEFIDHRTTTYSEGQRRRLDIALGIMHRPEVLFYG